MSRTEKLNKHRAALVTQAEELKQELWVLLEECDDEGNVRETMNTLLDEIESLSFSE